MQPAAVRKRNQRERARTRPTPVTPAPAQTSSAVPPQDGGGPLRTPAPASQPPQGVPRDVPRVTLLETEIVHGPGADAFVGPTAIGSDDAGAAGTPLVEPEAPAPPPKTSPEEAALLAAGYRKFCELGWIELLGRNQEFVSRVVPPHMQALIVAGGGQMVEESAARLAVKLNIRIPRQDETICVVGGAVAAVGIVGTLRAGNDNKPSTKKVGGGDAATSSPPPRPTSPSVTDAELVDEDLRDGHDDQDAGGDIIEPLPSQKASNAGDEELIDL